MCLLSAFHKKSGSAKTSLILLISVFCCLPFVQAQPTLQFGTYGLEEGLSASSISDVFQDRKGYLWIGTRSGLNRFDGTSFTEFRRIPGDSTSLGGDFVSTSAIAEDSLGHLWIGTRSGLSRYNPFTDVFVNFVFPESDSISAAANVVTAVMVASDGRIWSTSHEGVVVRDIHGEVVDRFLNNIDNPGSIPSNFVLSISEDDQGDVWVGTVAGLAKISPISRVVERYPIVDRLWSLLVTDDGTIWTGGMDGRVYALDPDDGTIISHQLFADLQVANDAWFVVDLFEDEDGSMWASTYGGGLFHYSSKTWSRYSMDSNESFSLPSDNVTALFQDNGGVLWVATWNGLSYVKPGKDFGDALDYGIGELVARDVLISKNGVEWVGTEDEGLIRISSAGVSVFDASPGNIRLSSSDVNAVMEDHAGNVWIGTSGGGINMLDPVSGKIELFSAGDHALSRYTNAYIYDILEDSQHRIWISTLSNGLLVFEPTKNEVTQFSFSSENENSIGSNEVWPIFEDMEGRIWVGTLGGGLNLLNVFETNDGKLDASFDRFQADANIDGTISSNNVVSIFQDTAGILWLGTMGGGLNRFDLESGVFTSWGTSDGLAHENVSCILPDKAGYLWLPATFGMSRFHKATGVFNTYTAEDALPGQIFPFNGCDIHDGIFYMASHQGVITFDPMKIEHNDQPPLALITDIEVANESFKMDSSATYKKYVTLKHDENFLRFHFGSTDYAIPSKNQYKYMLEGVDTDWVIDPGLGAANYPKVQPGTYTFKVQASNSDGIWSESPASMTVVIKKPINQRWWFRAGLVGIFAGLYWLFNRDRRLRRKELEDTRRQIADDLHDDMSGNLSALSIFLSRLGKKEILTPTDRKQARIYLAAVNRMSEDVRDVVWMANPGKDTLGALLERMQATLGHLLLNIDYTFLADDVDWDMRVPMNLRKNLFLVHKEAVHNVVRHARASKVEVRVWQRKGRIKIEIKDNGSGFNLEEANFGNGIFSMRRRAVQSNLDVDIDSVPGKGTAVSIEAEIT